MVAKVDPAPWIGQEWKARKEGEGDGEGVSSHRILTDGDCLCWLMATYVAHTSHYGAVLGPRSRAVT